MANPAVAQSKDNEANFNSTGVRGITTTLTSASTAGNSIVAFDTFSDFAGVHNDNSATDNASTPNAYTLYTQQNTNPSGGAASLGLLLAQNILSCTTVTTQFSNVSDFEDFWAAFIIEVSNLSSTPLVGSSGNTQNALAPGTNACTSGSIYVPTATPAIMLAACMNSSQAGGAGSTPTPGTGMTLLANAWASGGNNTLCVATQNISAAGNYSALFNQASSASEDMATVMVILKGISVAPTASIAWING